MSDWYVRNKLLKVFKNLDMIWMMWVNAEAHLPGNEGMDVMDERPTIVVTKRRDDSHE